MNNRNAEPNTATRDERSNAIHTTLPMAELIGLFESEIREILRYDSFEYENARESTHLFHGTPRLHKCHYRIRIADMELGRITLTRGSPFADTEIDVLEGALGALTIHLNNALEYQAGLGENELVALRADSEYSALDD